MKNLKMSKKLPILISTVAMAIAATSSSMCLWVTFNECKMPKSLYKAD